MKLYEIKSQEDLDKHKVEDGYIIKGDAKLFKSDTYKKWGSFIKVEGKIKKIDRRSFNDETDNHIFNIFKKTEIKYIEDVSGITLRKYFLMDNGIRIYKNYDEEDINKCEHIKDGKLERVISITNDRGYNSVEMCLECLKKIIKEYENN